MQGIATGLSKFFANVAPEQAKALRIAQNNARFETAVRRTWGDNPDAASFLLAHVNALYVKQDEAPRTGRDKDKARFELHVHLDDSLARSELNARRETLLFALARERMTLDGIVIHPSTGNVKEHRTFPRALEQCGVAHASGAGQVNGAGTVGGMSGATGANGANGAAGPDAKGQSDAVEKRIADEQAADQRKVLETFKRAVCVSFERLEVAEALLDAVEGAVLLPRSFMGRDGKKRWTYACHLFVRAQEFSAVAQAFATQNDTVRTKAKGLGMLISRIEVHESPEMLRGERAFPRAGQPCALTSAQVRELLRGRDAAGRG